MSQINYFQHSLHEDEIEKAFTYDEETKSDQVVNNLDEIISGRYPAKKDQSTKQIPIINPSTFKLRLNNLNSFKKVKPILNSSSGLNSSLNSISSNYYSNSSNNSNYSSNFNKLNYTKNSSKSNSQIYQSTPKSTLDSSINLKDSYISNDSNHLDSFNSNCSKTQILGSKTKCTYNSSSSSIDLANLDEKFNRSNYIPKSPDKECSNELKANFSQIHKIDKLNESLDQRNKSDLDLFDNSTIHSRKRSNDHLEDSQYLPPKKRWALSWQNSQIASDTIDLSSSSSSTYSSPKLISTSTENGLICTSESSSQKASAILREMSTPKLTSQPHSNRSPSITSSTNLGESNSTHKTPETSKSPTNEAAPLNNTPELDNKTQSTNNQKSLKKIFNYFKAPQVSKIQADERMQNNFGYKILVEEYSDLFEEFQHFNEVQIRSISPIFESNKSLVVKSPTGSGK